MLLIHLKAWILFIIFVILMTKNDLYTDPTKFMIQYLPNVAIRGKLSSSKKYMLNKI